MSRLSIMPERFEPVTPSDSTEYSPLIEAVYVGTAGTVTGVGEDDVSAPFVALAGSVVIGPFKKIMSTGTDATDLVGYFSYD